MIKYPDSTKKIDTKNIPWNINPSEVQQINKETRFPVSNVMHKYYSAVGIIFIHYTDLQTGLEGREFGTGTLIAPNLVITAAHNTDMRGDKSKKVNFLTFSPGKTKIDENFEGEIRVKENKVYDSCKIVDGIPKIPSTDIAILILERSVSSQTIWATYQALPDSELKDLWVTITGYPGISKKKEEYEKEIFKGEKNKSEFIPFMVRKPGKIDNVTGDRLYYNIKVSEGQSGSAIVKTTKGPKFIILGIHSLGNETLIASRITPKVVLWLDAIKNQYAEKVRKLDYITEYQARTTRVDSKSEFLGKSLEFLIEITSNFEAIEIDDYICISREILKQLDSHFGPECGLWIGKFFYLSYLNRANFEDNKDELEKYQKLNTDLIQNYIKDARGLRSIFNYPKIFQNDLFKKIEDKKHRILDEFISKIENALDFCLWNKRSPNSIRFCTSWLLELRKITQNKDFEEALISSISNGRFDKKIFNLKYSIILGDDGGLYILLNSLAQEDREILIEILRENGISEKYISEHSLQNQDQSSKSKIVIGQGSFGKVRFCMSLFLVDKESRAARPGEVICVKKSEAKLKSSKKIEEAEVIEDKSTKDNIEESKEAYEQFVKDMAETDPKRKVVVSVIGDYFASNEEISRIISSPVVLDMAITKRLKKDEKYIKGYTIMEIEPHNTASNIFFGGEKKYKNWILYVKPYLCSLLQKILDLLDYKVVMTDLKPENTLFNLDTKEASIIDLGGSIKVPDPEWFIPEKEFLFQYTEYYSSPELLSFKEKGINFKKSLSYTCGKIINDFCTASIIEDNYIHKMTSISSKMLEKNPQLRLSLEEALKEISNVGNDEDKDRVLLEQYIQNMRLKYQAALNFPENILKIKEWLIPAKLVKLDPNQYTNLETYDATKVIGDFLSKPFSAAKSIKALLINGNSGSGKTTLLQLEFLRDLNSWEIGQPIPLYIDLATTTDIMKSLDFLDLGLKTKIKQLLTESKSKFIEKVNLYLNNFDQGLYLEHYPRKEYLLNDYSKILESVSCINFIVNCHVDFTFQDKWFQKRSGNTYFAKFYITPLGYGESNSLEKYIKNFMIHNDLNLAFEEVMRRIEENYLGPYVDSPQMFKILIQIIERLSKPKTILSIQDIVDLYLDTIYEESFSQKLTPEQKFNLNPFLKSKENCNDICREIATELFLTQKNYIDNSSPIFKKYKYHRHHHFKIQSLYAVFNLLPVKIEIINEGDDSINKHGILKEEITIRFINDLVKNYYIYSQMKIQLEKEGQSIFLNTRYITKEKSLMEFLAKAVAQEQNPLMKNHLLLQINRTKRDKSSSSSISASNSISILVSAKVSFSNSDLSNVDIRNANIRNGIFNLANLQNANLENVNLTNVKMLKADLSNSNVSHCEFGLSKAIKTKHGSFYSAIISPDDKFIIFGHNTGLIFIKDRETLENIYTLVGHEKKVTHLVFSDNKVNFVSSSYDGRIIIWNYEKFCLEKIIEFIHPIEYFDFCSKKDRIIISFQNGNLKLCSISNPEISYYEDTTVSYVVKFSPCKKFIAIPKSNLVSLIDSNSGKHKKSLVFPELSGKEVLKKLDSQKERPSGVMLYSDYSVDFSPEGTFIACLFPKRDVMIMEIQNERLTFLRGSGPCNKLKYSPDGACIATANTFLDEVKVWDSYNGNLLNIIKSDRHLMFDLVFSPCSKFLGMHDSAGKSFKLWNISKQNRIQSQEGHNENIENLIFLDSDQLILSKSSYENCKLWNTKSGNFLLSLENSDDVIQIISSRDGKSFAGIDRKGSILLWDIKSGRLVKRLKFDNEDTTTLCFSHDGKFIYSCHDSVICCWDIESENTVEITEKDESSIQSICLSNKGDVLGLLAKDSTVFTIYLNVYFILNRREITLQDDTYDYISFSHDDQCILLLGKGIFVYNLEFSKKMDSLARSEDIEENQENKPIENEENSEEPDFLEKFRFNQTKTIKKLDFDSSKYLNISDGLPEVSLFNLNNIPDKALLAYPEEGLDETFNSETVKEIEKMTNDIPNSYFNDIEKLVNFASSDKIDNMVDVTKLMNDPESMLHDLEGMRQKLLALKMLTEAFDFPKEIMKFRVSNFSFSPEQRYLACSNLNKTIAIYDLKSHTLKQKISDFVFEVQDVKYSSDGQFILCCSGKAIRIYKGTKVCDINRIKGRGSPITSISHSSNGKYFVTTSLDDGCKLYTANIQDPPKLISNEISERVLAAIFSHDCSKVILGNSDNAIYVYDIQSSKIMKKLDKHSARVNSLVLIGEQILASGSWDSTIKLWDTSTWEEINTISSHNGMLSSIDYSPRNDVLVCGYMDGYCLVWDMQGKKVNHVIPGHKDSVSSVKCEKEGKHFISASWDKTCKIWEISTGILIQTLTGHSDVVTGISVSPNGFYFATSSWDGSCLIWESVSGRLLQKLKSQKTKMNCVSFLSDSSKLFTGNTLSQIEIWDTIFEGNEPIVYKMNPEIKFVPPFTLVKELSLVDSNLNFEGAKLENVKLSDVGKIVLDLNQQKEEIAYSFEKSAAPPIDCDEEFELYVSNVDRQA